MITYTNALTYFLTISVCLLLLYNFLATVLFSFKKELLLEKKKVLLGQKMLLTVIFIVFIIYLITAKNIPTDLFVLPWIWGFLTGHIVIARKNRWLNELLGLGVLLAITIVLFFKQTEIIQTVFNAEMNSIKYEIFVVYLISGFILGRLFWSRST